MISLWWSFTLTAIGGLGIFLAYRSQSLLGPLVGIAAQSVWLAYSVVSQQWWFLFSVLIYGGSHLYGIVKRRRTTDAEA